MKPATPRRSEALSKIRIVEAAIGILDAENSGAGELTLRSVMTQLSTGSGAIYHHVANMDELRAAAADEVLRGALADIPSDLDADEALRLVGLGIFDSIGAHPWVGAQLTRKPFQPAVVLIWKTIGLQLRRLGLGGPAAMSAGSTLANFILGAAAQYAAGPARVADGKDRDAFLKDLGEAWSAVDDDAVVLEIASELGAHDDRQQFMDGIDIILRGMKALPRQTQ
ncbi:TetR/AcrR family transcriptional regulator [Glaciihabitans sp. dw_435]|uniref:TetR/AcrR family transcriptional regulator n=1 Tax=Glaciihabitans sp. dw_435 TaxID=2720081 RepID=UPI001BD25510|nr:TetR/AcrR family transcriptional regulator C-terminal domain-containing protein [Glaciihabitans sp. dw_435]